MGLLCRMADEMSVASGAIIVSGIVCIVSDDGFRDVGTNGCSHRSSTPTLCGTGAITLGQGGHTEAPNCTRSL